MNFDYVARKVRKSFVFDPRNEDAMAFALDKCVAGGFVNRGVTQLDRSSVLVEIRHKFEIHFIR